MHSCCNASYVTEQPADVCKRCGVRGQAVPPETLDALLTGDAHELLKPGAYFFDLSPECEVVYFSNEHNSCFTKSDLRIRVGTKEDRSPIPLCYCFGHTLESTRLEIETTGQSTVAAQITKDIQAGNCACEVKNPSGRCCLGEVKKAVEQLLAEFEKLDCRR